MANPTILFIIEFIIALGVMIFIHELGHFAVMRLFKIEVEEFGFGFPPRITRLFKLWNTEFTLNWLPFGGFVRPKGENDPNIPGGLAAANPWKRLAALVAGPLMNLTAGIILFSIVFMRSGTPQTNIIKVMEVVKESPAAVAGIQANDIIRQVNGIQIDSTEKIIGIIQQYQDKEVEIILERNGNSINVKVVPKLTSENKVQIGIMMGYPTRPISWTESVPLAINTSLEQAKNLIMLPIQLINGAIKPGQVQVMGPIRMGETWIETRNMDAEYVQTQGSSAKPFYTLYLLAVISTWLGMVNLLPIPAVDGGRIFFTMPELLFKKRVPAKFENMVHLIGFALLILLMVVVAGSDIISLSK
jgi:regulator of sigma E protease